MSKDLTKMRRTALLGSAATLLAGFALGVGITPVSAQDADTDADEFEEVVVTGSRIVRKDLVSPSPISTVGAEEFQLTGAQNVEQVLATLPQTIPGFGGSSNNPGNGTATVNLRGLGTTRTLVLVNGRRYLQSSQSGVVDLNTIPPSLIERVEVVTGGASAVYGSDALAGVVNFILKDDFEGLEVSGQYDTTTHGDAEKYTIDMTIGGNFDDGRGNATLFMSYAKRKPLLQGDRDFSSLSLGDSGADIPAGDTTFGGGSGLFSSGSSGIPGTRLFGSPTLDPLGDTVFTSNADGTVSTTGDADDFALGRFNTDGSGSAFTNADRFNYAPDNFLQLPQERWMMSSSAHYDISDKVTVYGEATFVSNRVPQELAPTPAFLGTLAVNVNSPFFDSIVRGTLGADGIRGNNVGFDGIAGVNGGADGIIGRLSGADGDIDTLGDNLTQAQVDVAILDDFNDDFNDDTGLEALDPDGDGIADLPFIGRRMVENGSRQSIDSRNGYRFLVGVRGEFSEGWNYDLSYNFSRLERSNLLNNDVSDSRFRQAVLVTDDGLACQDPSGGCAPLNVFGEGNISQAAIDFIKVGAANITTIQSQNIQALVSGSLGDLTGAGEVAVAFGAEYRSDSSNFRPDEFLSGGDVLGFNAGRATVGGFNVKELFGEVIIPLLSDSPGAESLEINLAARYSDYSTAGSIWSYAGGVTYSPVSDLLIRANYQRAVRAPTVSELFLGQANGFPGADDPCSDKITAETDTALCIASGVAAGNVGVFTQANTQIEGLFGGNPDLTEETADTYTVGAVFTPEAVPGLSVAVDYYNIEIENMISVLGGGVNNVLDLCFNKVKDANSPFCQAITRRPDGNVGVVQVLNANIASASTSGIDVQINYSTEVDWGFFDGGSTLNFAFVGTHVIENDTVPTVFPDNPELESLNDCEGNFGNICGEPDPAYRFNLRTTLTNGPLTLSANWRWLDAVTDDQIDNNGLAASDLIVPRLKAENYFDLSFTYDLSDRYQLYGGARNLFANKPSFVGDSQEQANTFPETYTLLGTRLFIGAKLRF